MFDLNIGNDAQAQVEALSKSQAIIEFDLDGTILTANTAYLETVGYALHEIQGRHHSMFLEKSERDSAAYREFWQALRCGKFRAAEFKRLAKNGQPIWILASYNPILDGRGRPFKVVKFATDITRGKVRSLDEAGKIAAINRTQAVIEFELDGTIITANENFLRAVGYSLPEIAGGHHRMFVEPGEWDAAASRAFWARLAEGEYHAGEYRRLGKGGRELWILAAYNPILDDKGKPFKVVKFATDITEQRMRFADYAGQIAAIRKSSAVAEFSLDGTVIAANENFLTALGYSLHEILGKHHAMFVSGNESTSKNYDAFWRALREGQHQAGEYVRIARGGRHVRLQASYNPVLDLNGSLMKIVMYASDVSLHASGLA